jgi:hypothetical protein
LPVPFDNGVGLEDLERRAPVGPQPGEADPEETIPRAKLRPFDRALQDNELMLESEVFSDQGGSACHGRSKDKPEGSDPFH